MPASGGPHPILAWRAAVSWDYWDFRRRESGDASSHRSSGTAGAASGGSSRNGRPCASVKVSREGSKDKRPAIAKATTISGLAMKLCVEVLPSLRPGKLRLNDVTMLFAVRCADSSALRH